jgi:hypothetical protein
MKKSIILISVGLLNTIHGSFHIIQFIQSMMLVAYVTNHNEEHHGIDRIMHHPIFALVMGIIGIATLIIGVKDYIHHMKCKTHK